MQTALTEAPLCTRLLYFCTTFYVEFLLQTDRVILYYYDLRCFTMCLLVFSTVLITTHTHTFIYHDRYDVTYIFRLFVFHHQKEQFFSLFASSNISSFSKFAAKTSSKWKCEDITTERDTTTQTNGKGELSCCKLRAFKDAGDSLY
jgi:hypothetical protein